MKFIQFEFIQLKKMTDWRDEKTRGRKKERKKEKESDFFIVQSFSALNVNNE
jgi:hypothetical protein